MHKCFGMPKIFTSLAIALEFEDCLLLMPDRLHHQRCNDYLRARCSEGIDSTKQRGAVVKCSG